VDPTGLYEEDVHRSLTAVLALAVGFDASVANAIAAANQGIDDNPKTVAHSGFAASSGYHFTTQKRRDELWATFESSKTPESLGTFLHPEQDRFSHAGFGPTLGHVVVGHAPDKTYNDPEKADQMAEATYRALADAAEIMQMESSKRVPYRVISGLVKRFNDARTDKEKAELLTELRLVISEGREGAEN
jgi:hypothetical protein